MDWTSELEQKFGEDKEVKTLKKDEFYGQVTLNFFKGSIIDLNKYQTRKPVAK